MRFTRRETLIAGAAALAGAAIPGGRRARAEVGSAKNLLIVLAAGGWDVTWGVDPKPNILTIDGGQGTVMRFGDSQVLVGDDRPQVQNFFEKYGPITAVVNGLGVRSIAHPVCRRRVLTGSGSLDAPDVGALAAHALGRDRPVPYLVLGSTAFAGPLAASTGRVGATNQILALLDPAQDYAPSDGRGPGFVPDIDDDAMTQKFLTARAERERAVIGQVAGNDAMVSDFLESQDRAGRLRAYKDKFGSRGLTLSLPDQAKLAADAVGEGIARSVMLDTLLPWDTHSNDALQGKLHGLLFGGLSTLMKQLHDRPGGSAGHTLLDETVVVVLSEMSRTPKMNLTAGKDHWPYTSALVIGSGVRGGQTFGATDDMLTAVPMDLDTGATGSGTALQTNNLLAGVLALAGADPSAAFPGVEPLLAIQA